MKEVIAKRLFAVAAVGVAGLMAACASNPPHFDDVSVNPTTEDYVSRFSDDRPDVPPVLPEAINGRPSRDAGAPREVSERRQPVAETENELVRLADFYANQAARHYSEKRYEEALQYARDALLMDSNNNLAATVRADSEQALGRDRSLGGAMARSRSQEAAAIRAEAIYDISSGLDRANKRLEAGEYTEAIAEIEKVLDIIRWTNYMIETEAYEREARLMLQEAQTRREQVRLDDYVRIREQERRLRELEIQEELERYREEIRNLYTQAKELFDRREYRDTVIVLDKILREDPYNDQVARLRQIAADLERGRRDRTAWEDFRRNWQATMAEVFAANAMPLDDITLPDYEHWERTKQRAQRLEAQRVTRLSREDIAIRNALETVNVQVNYADLELGEVIRRLRTDARVNIILSRNSQDRVGRDPISLEDVGRVRLRQALEMILDQVPRHTWRVENGAIIIDDQDAADDRGGVRRVFNVADLLINLRDFRGNEPRLAADDQRDPRWREEEEQIQDDPPTVDDLRQLIMDAVEQDSWVRGNHGITPRQQDLIIINTPDNIDRVANLLDDLRRAQGLSVSIEARFITIREDFLEDIGIDFRGVGGSPQIPPPGVPPVPALLDDIQFGTPSNPAGPGGTGNNAGFFFQDMPPSGNVRIDQRARIENLFDQALGGRRGNIGLTGTGGMAFQVAFVDNPQINAVIRAVRKRERATLLTAPRITVHNTQRAHVSIMNEIAYISDFDTDTAAGVAVANPMVDVIRDGIVLDVRPTISADRRYVTLELRPTLATLLRPIPTFQTSLGVGPPVAIQTPQLTLQRVRTTITLPDGGSFVIGGLRQMSETQQESGVPILSDIPLIGWLFKRQGKSVIRQDIIIIVSARIIDLEEEEEYQYGAGPTRPR